jgi:DNA-binding Lrp family transcriptional regulator
MDSKDKKLLTLLQENSREQLKILGRKIGLSIDSTKKRIEKLKKAGILARFSVFIDPKAAGYDLISNVSIKLNNVGEEDLKKFIQHLKKHPNVTTLITTLGEYDMTCVVIAENTEKLEFVFRNIRHKFKNIISDWRSVINLKVHKFEWYEL